MVGKHFALTRVRYARLLVRLLYGELGATAIGYCLIAAGLGIVILGGVNGIGAALNTEFATINTSLK